MVRQSKPSDILPILIMILTVGFIGSLMFRQVVQTREGSFTVTYDDIPGKTSFVFYNRVAEATQPDGRTGYLYYNNDRLILTQVGGDLRLSEMFLLSECVSGYTGGYTIRDSEWGDITYDHGSAYVADSVQFTSPVSIVDIYKAAEENGIVITGQSLLGDGTYVYEASLRHTGEQLSLDTVMHNMSIDGRFENVSRVPYKYSPEGT